jgi:hypothetical protein
MFTSDFEVSVIDSSFCLRTLRIKALMNLESSVVRNRVRGNVIASPVIYHSPLEIMTHITALLTGVMKSQKLNGEFCHNLKTCID